MDEAFSVRLEKIEKTLDEALSFTVTSAWRREAFGTLPGDAADSHIQPLIEPCKTLMNLGGKRWRPLLLVLSAEQTRSLHGGCGLLSESETYSLTPLVEFVHTASLIHDDIEDSSDMRRGKPAAYITYGLDTALNAASWLYFEAPVCIDRLAVSPEAKNTLYALYTRELRRLHLGQAMDISWHRNSSFFPSAGEYTAMVRCKTGTLASLAAQTGVIAGGGSAAESEKAGQTAAQIGEGFQILDDVQNLTTGNPGKKRGDDIVEGKKSLPVLMHIAERPADKETISRLFAEAHFGGIDSPAVEQCIALLTESGAVEKAAARGKKLVEDRCRELGSELITRLFTSMIPGQKEAHHA